MPSNIPVVQHLFFWYQRQLKIYIFTLMTFMAYFHSSQIQWLLPRQNLTPFFNLPHRPLTVLRLHTKNTRSSHLTLHCFNRFLGNPPHPEFHSDRFKALTTSSPHLTACGHPDPSQEPWVTTPTLAVLPRVSVSLAAPDLQRRPLPLRSSAPVLRPPRSSDKYWPPTTCQELA